jgi:general L-amino acid transport system permease protein
VTWIRKNLFSDWFNSILTLLIVALLLHTAIGFISWATTTAQWRVIPENLRLFMVGRFPATQGWRLWAMLGVIVTLSGVTWGILARNVSQFFSRNILIILGIAAVIAALVPARLWVLPLLALLVVMGWIGRQVGHRFGSLGKGLSAAWGLSFFVVLWLLMGGLGLRNVSTNDWGGLLLTVFLAMISIVLSFPFGVLLALGRQSNLPVVRLFSVLYIELIRGLPLVSILFMGQVMIPLFLPEGARPDRIPRAIVGLTLFTAAYMAENVRGGLQSIPRGQTEAASALGLNKPLALTFIILPQALRVSIPAIVGQFISLFQDTTLLSIVGVLELLGISRSVLSNPQFIGRYAEVYLFLGVVYWVFCYAMSWGSRKLEERLNTSH